MHKISLPLVEDQIQQQHKVPI